jgi:hypothetical protein
MIVPTGSERFATSTRGPVGTACCGAAVTEGAADPVNRLLARKAVQSAITSAPTSRITLRLSMAFAAPKTLQNVHIFRQNG